MTLRKQRKIYRLINILFKTVYKKKSPFWKADFLKKHNIFYKMGANVYWGGDVPADPFLVSVGNNVTVASGVEFVTHDIFYHVFNNIPEYQRLGRYYPHFDTIEIQDNVCIGGFCRIMPGVVIEANSIVAGGSVVTKNVPSGCIVGGNPAKIIGSFDELARRRANFMENMSIDSDIQDIREAYWENEK